MHLHSLQTSARLLSLSEQIQIGCNLGAGVRYNQQRHFHLGLVISMVRQNILRLDWAWIRSSLVRPMVKRSVHAKHSETRLGIDKVKLRPY